MHSFQFSAASVLVLLAVCVSCSATSDANPYENGETGGASGSTGGEGMDGLQGTGGTGGTSSTGGMSGTGDMDSGVLWDGSLSPDVDRTGPGICQAGPDEDADGDGYSINEGDCNDCDPNANPGAFDVVGGVEGGEGVDEDCDGVIDNEPTDCDIGMGFEIADTDPGHAAKSIGLCRVADPDAQGPDKTWGVISAKYVLADGTSSPHPLSHGLLPQFGAASVRHGETMLALSSGTARAPNHEGFQTPLGTDMEIDGNPPQGYPKESQSCPGVITGGVHDAAALELQIRVPTNANSFSFDLNFYTYEFPNFICSQFNDFFVTMMTPAPPNLPDGNISFDQDGNPISVNNSLLQVCNAQIAFLKFFPCPLGSSLLAGTGFDEMEENGPHAATGWLQTRAPVEPGSTITLRFAIWDSGDHVLDSTVLIDNFQWSVEPAEAAETKPVIVPK